MGSPCPPHWSFAARAAYFGDRMCPFCDHRNPAGARFCNECASPLHLKPCRGCDAINDQAAMYCHNCGAACPMPFDPVEATAEVGVAVAQTADPPPSAVAPQRAGSPSRGTETVLVAATATVLIAGAYAAYRITTDTPEVASRASITAAHTAFVATPAATTVVDLQPFEPAATSALPTPMAATDPAPSKGASADPRPFAVPAKPRAGARQHPPPRAPVSATAPVSRGRAPANGGAPVAQIQTPLRPTHWQAMHESLARCGGDLLARIVCEQRVRLHFCEGHWGVAPECAGGIVNEHGQ